jgi:hypothetical protein
MKRLFVETSVFTKALEAKNAKALLEQIQAKILDNPEAGDVMPGCGGVRKLRVADPTRRKGTRGGLRVLFLDLPHKDITYLIYVYGKDEAENVSTEDKKRIREIATLLRGEGK